MTKLGTILFSLGIVAILIISGCSQPSAETHPSPTPAPEGSTEQQPSSETQTPPSETSGNEPAVDAEEPQIPDESVEQTEPVETPLPMGRIEVRVTDAPPREEVTSILVTVAENSVYVHQAVAEQEQEQIGEGEQNQNQEQQQEQQGEGSWLPLNMVEGAEQFDLLEIKGLEEVLAVGDLAAGKYTQIRLDVSSVEVTLGDDEEYQVAELTGGELKFVRPFDVVEGETTILLLDFDADKSVNSTGQGKIHVKPVVKLTIQQGKPHDLTSVEGTISEVDLELGTVSIIPTGETEAIVLDIIPQTEITLDDMDASLDDLDGLEEGNSATAYYYQDNFKVTRIDVYTLIDLSLDKSVDEDTPNVGDYVVFTITVANDGLIDATEVEVTDLLPEGYTYDSDTPSQGTYDYITGIWDVGTITSESNANLTITATVNASGDYENEAEVTAAYQTDSDSTPDNGANNEDDYDSQSTTPSSP